ncbi:type II toxin-antitoxin system death-on-curing family toxin [Bacillus cereus]|uniref:type II toxin-antitoxin system death-on-curing family toxin n=1 Tax=Bacillus cereus TaxID=1396 RepID=UPI0019258644|nr:type II toxin-antitoxin system death-on-curing family toxin [Bacillus cereus]MBL3881653.1 type II toxin-antitoxin system death-on-curing family toxin [Bacillus cereus]HDR8481118.1 type II toxin-antitoxin system death-on-curing family toxin [Bacillus cereus]
MVFYLSEEEALIINTTLINMYSPGEFMGIKDKALLDSALNRPKQTVLQQDAYPTLFHKAAALFESLAQNHAFYNANKRTAFACVTVFLQMNGYQLMIPEDFATEFTVDVVKHLRSFNDIEQMLRTNSIPI